MRSPNRRRNRLSTSDWFIGARHLFESDGLNHTDKFHNNANDFYFMTQTSVHNSG